MASGLEESTSRPPQYPHTRAAAAAAITRQLVVSSPTSVSTLAQDPIVKHCGHLFCWPCLYKWLHIHSQSQQFPMCKALVKEEKLVPLYGRGKTSTTTPPPEPCRYHPQHGFGFMVGLGGFAPMATAAGFGNFTLSAAFGGLFPSLFNFQVHRCSVPTMYGPTGLPYGFQNPFPDGGNTHAFNHLEAGGSKMFT